ncbi:Acetamidase regulatory protein [Colletotrichum tropicale]|nr:Acetamidase regulatory protein [Colletotrichum tropicale]
MAIHEGLPPRIVQARDVILGATQANILPAPSLRKALMDSFIEYVLPYCPVVDSKDLTDDNSSTLIQLAVCLVGSLMRHDPSSLQLSYSFYEKIQTLLYIDFEDDNMALLKTFCLLSCWAPASPYRVTLHGPWHWTGMAVRLAIQMGVHTQSSYAEDESAGCLRRIFWYLNNTETLMVACWGRPRSLKPEDCDVQPLEASDFAAEGVLVMVSLHFTRLMNVTRSVAELNTKKGVPSEHEVEEIITSLCTWYRGLPEELRLHDQNGTRRPFNRFTSELHIHYLTTIILIQMLSKDRHSPWRTSPASIVAASCVAHLYEEIHCREQAVHLLSVNGFLALVAAIVLVFQRPKSPQKEVIRNNGVNSICSVLRLMCAKYGGARSVLKRVQELQLNAEGRETSTNCHQNGGPASCAPWVARAVNKHIHELFPFPLSFCDNMDFLDLVETRWDHLSFDAAGAADSMPFEQVWDSGFSLMDILEDAVI